MKHWIITHDHPDYCNPRHYIVTTEVEDLVGSGVLILEEEELETPLAKRIIKHLGLIIEHGQFIAIEESDQPTEFEPEDTFIIQGSWGSVTANRETGYVRKYDDQDTLKHDRTERGYKDIVRFDVGEYRENCSKDIPDEVDILDMSYCMKDGKYESHMRDRHEGLNNWD